MAHRKQYAQPAFRFGGTGCLAGCGTVAAIVALLLVGLGIAFLVSDDSEEPRAAANPPPAPLPQRVAYVSLQAGRIVAPQPGYTRISMLPTWCTGCMVAPEGWYLATPRNPPWDQRGPDDRERGRPHLEVRVDCHRDGRGVVSYRNSEFRPGSLNICNWTGEPVNADVFMAPLDYRAP